jgi:archaellum biogenesis protein FlaJ (TadC family)
VGETKAPEQDIAEIEQIAAQQAKYRANVARWSIEIAIFLFALLIILIILLSEGIGIEIVAPIAIFGLAMVWFVGRRQGKQLYKRFYHEEMRKLRLELKGIAGETLEDELEEQVREALARRRKQ